MTIGFNFLADGSDVESGTAMWQIGSLHTKECRYASFTDANYTDTLLREAYRHGKADGIEQCKQAVLEQQP